MTEKENYEQLKIFAAGEGASLFGVADVAAVAHRFNALSPKTVEGLNRAVSVAFPLSGRVLEDVVAGPTKLYFFHYQRVNMLLDGLGLKITNYLQSRGWDALPIPASQLVDWEKQLAHISHKHVAVETGIGWIGRNNLLVTPQFGARVRLITVLTNMPLHPDRPASFGCGECHACLQSCPYGSIKEKPEEFDHVGCYQMMKVLVKKAGISQNVCGLCVKACKGKRVEGYE
jgi:epoxyqueuosine reductase